MEYMNKIELRGIVGVIHTHNVGGKQYASFSMATEYAFKDKDGYCVIETTWHNVLAWDGEFGSITKGSKVYVIGRLRTRRYIDAEGNERCSTEVIAQEVNIVE